LPSGIGTLGEVSGDQFSKCIRAEGVTGQSSLADKHGRGDAVGDPDSGPSTELGQERGIADD
jgi:hypothetical protein